MNHPVKFVGDLTELPTHAYGHRSLTWWGILSFFMIEGTFFALAMATYFYLAGGEQSWPPGAIHPPSLLAGILFTLVILLSEIPNTILKRAAERKDLRTAQKYLLAMSGVGILLCLIRVFEFPSLNVMWTDNAYGSILWALLFLHTTHIVTDLGDTLVLTALMFTRHGAEARRFVDVAENAMYWRFVWVCWLPIYLLIYWLPRWMP
jgi:heme/copper-type cytochrome/quinol oxidase subunit 3